MSKQKNANETLGNALKIIFGKPMSFDEMMEKYELEEYEFPYTTKTIKLRERFRVLIVSAILVIIFGILIKLLLNIDMSALHQYVAKEKIVNAITLASRIVKGIGYALLLWAILVRMKVFIYQVVRQRLYERDVAKNDKFAMQLKADIIKSLSLDRKVQKLRDKEERSKESNSSHTVELSEEEKAKLEAVDLIHDMVVQVNTRENAYHIVQDYSSITIMEEPDGLIQDAIYEYIKATDKKGDNSILSSVASKATKQKIKYGAIIDLDDGSFTVRAKFNKRNDPYYFDDQIRSLERKIHNANVQHSFPYRKGTIDEPTIVNGLSDNTEKNRKNKELATIWANKQVQFIEDTLNQNGIQANYNKNFTKMMPTTAELLYTTPPTYKVGKNNTDLLADICKKIDENCEVKGTSAKITADGVHISLTIPNGRDHEGLETKINYTQITNFEDILRRFCG